MTNSYVRIPEPEAAHAAVVEPAPQPRPERVEKTSSRVRIYTPSGIIEGSHHHPDGVRVSDMLRNQASSEKYLLLTDAVIVHTDGSTLSMPFVLIGTPHASILVPLDGSDTSREAIPYAAALNVDRLVFLRVLGGEPPGEEGPLDIFTNWRRERIGDVESHGDGLPGDRESVDRHARERRAERDGGRRNSPGSRGRRPPGGRGRR